MTSGRHVNAVQNAFWTLLEHGRTFFWNVCMFYECVLLYVGKYSNLEDFDKILVIFFDSSSDFEDETD